MIRYVSDVWNKIHRARIANTATNLFFIKNYFLNTKTITSDLIHYILSVRGITTKSLRFYSFESFFTQSSFFIFITVLVLLSFGLFLV